MNVTLGVILMVAAFVLFLLSAVLWPPTVDPYRFRLVAAGLACWSLAILVGRVAL